MDITLASVDPADSEAAQRAFEIQAAVGAADLPDFPPVCPDRFFADLRHPWPGVENRFVLAYLDRAPVGLLRLTLPQLDNIDNAEVEVSVLPQYRRRGVGRRLYEHAVRLAKSEGRKRLFAMTVSTLPGGPTRTEAGGAFAQAIGATRALVDIRSRLNLTDVDDADLDRLLADARPHAAGYSLVQWSGAAPDEYVDDVAYLDSRLIEDAPMGDLDWEPEKVDAARVRAIEAAQDLRRRRRYHTGMRHDASGRLVAWTMLDLGPNPPWHAFQQITLVEPRHRGHRLGMIIKVENLRYTRAHEPALRFIDTWNAAVNDHMLAINRAMGFRPVDGWDNWQINL